jgi:hypothetical protein
MSMRRRCLWYRLNLCANALIDGEHDQLGLVFDLSDMAEKNSERLGRASCRHGVC